MRMMVTGFLTPKKRILLWPSWLDDLPNLLKINPETELPFIERLDASSVGLFSPVVKGLVLWGVVFERITGKMQRRVVNPAEAKDRDLN